MSKFLPACMLGVLLGIMGCERAEEGEESLIQSGMETSGGPAAIAECRPGSDSECPGEVGRDEE